MTNSLVNTTCIFLSLVDHHLLQFRRANLIMSLVCEHTGLIDLSTNQLLGVKARVEELLVFMATCQI